MENEIAKSLNFFYKENNIKALCYRLFQSQYSKGQWADILSDSADKKYYYFLECKSINTAKYGTLNFRSRFSESEGVHQIDKEHFFLDFSGRKGYLVVECREGVGKKRISYFVPFLDVYEKYKSEERSFKVKEIMTYPKCVRVKGKYEINEEIFE